MAVIHQLLIHSTSIPYLFIGWFGLQNCYWCKTFSLMLTVCSTIRWHIVINSQCKVCKLCSKNQRKTRVRINLFFEDGQWRCVNLAIVASCVCLVLKYGLLILHNWVRLWDLCWSVVNNVEGIGGREVEIRISLISWIKLHREGLIIILMYYSKWQLTCHTYTKSNENYLNDSLTHCCT